MLDHRHLDCCTQGCYAVITVHPQELARLKETHETFYCPAGHQNYFPGKTEEEKKVDRLYEAIDDIRQERVLWVEHFYALERATRVCPFGCGWVARRRVGPGWPPSEAQISRFMERVGFDLTEHLRAEHNATPETIKLLTEKAGRG